MFLRKSIEQQHAAPVHREYMAHLWRWLREVVSFGWVAGLVFWLGTVVIPYHASVDTLISADGATKQPAIDRVPSMAGADVEILQVLRFDEPWVSQAYWLSFRISMATMLCSVIMCLFLMHIALAVPTRGVMRPFWQGCAHLTRSFGGVPFALAGIAVSTHSGLFTACLTTFFGVSLVQHDIASASFWQISLAYAALQIPLIVLCIAPALHDVNATRQQEIPTHRVITSSNLDNDLHTILISMAILTALLIFGSTFAAQATTCGEYGCQLSGLPYLLVEEQRTGDVPANPALGNTLSAQMVLTMLLAIMASSWISTMSKRGKQLLTTFLIRGASAVLSAIIWLLSD